jgi:hypothetical protein
LSEEELDQLHHFYERLAQLALKDANIHASHSIDAAERNQSHKHEFFIKKHEEWLKKQESKS